MGFYRYFDYAIKCMIRKIIYSKWFWRISFLIIILIIMFNFTSSVFAAEIPVTILNGLKANSTENPTTLGADDRFKGVYFPISKGLTYTCVFPSDIDTNSLRSVFTTVKPAVGVAAYDFSNAYDGLSSYSFISKYDGYCMFFNISDVSVTVHDDIENFDLVPVNFSSSGGISLGSTNSFSSGSGSIIYAYLENNVEYTLTVINSGSLTTFGMTYSPTIPYIDGYHNIIQFNYANPGVTYYKITGQNNYLCLAYTSGVTYTLGTIGSKGDTTLEDLNNTINNNDNAIIGGQENINNSINNQGEKIEDAMTSTEYDESTINIDTSVTDDLDDSSTTGLFTTVFDNLSNLISSSNWASVETIDIGIPFTDAKIQLRSDLLSKIVGNSLLANLINVAWYSLFGLYVFRFSTNIFHAIKSGDILNGLNLNNEVISSTML